MTPRQPNPAEQERAAIRQAIRDEFLMDVPKAPNFTVDPDYQPCYEETQDMLDRIMEIIDERGFA